MNKIVIIGCGNVGMSYAYCLLNSNSIVEEIVLIDINKDKAEGEALDLIHASACSNKFIKIKAGDYNDCNNADIVCICAGKNQKKGETRTDLIDKNVEVFKSIIKEINKTLFKGIFLIATNPLDIMTYVTLKLSKFKPCKVIGSGTTLDTARLRSILSEKLSINPKNVHAYVIGEHGDSEFINWSNAFIGPNPILNYIDENSQDEILFNVRNSAYEIINKKGNTSYGIGMCLKNITNAILQNSNSIFTISAYDKKLKICIGMPAIINKSGIREIINLNLNKDEKTLLKNCSDKIKSMVKAIENNLKY